MQRLVNALLPENTVIDIDWKAQEIHLHNGTTLRDHEIHLLHKLLRGQPRKLMAQEAFVTTKAIEKRLATLKDKLYIPQIPHATLQELVYQHGLSGFVLAYDKWVEICLVHTPED